MNLLPWLLFIPLTIIAYFGIAWFAQLSGGSASSPLSAALSAIKPFPLLVITLANMVFAVAAFYGFSVTRFAIPAMISLGAISGFLYSVFFLGVEVTLAKVAGIGLAVLGIALIAL
jgi:hypothetical protein